MSRVAIGLDHFLQNPPSWASGCRLGLLCNPASVDGAFRHGRMLVHERFPGNLRALYSPQHGFFAEKQDNMVESGDLIDPVLKIPVFSLYGKARIPTQEMLDPIDVLLVDLQDVGCRVYTFIYTLSYCMEAAGASGKKVAVLDRPNPIGGLEVEGNCLSPDWASFVGRYPIPMRHGLTVGELALLFNRHLGIGCDLTVIPMKGWKRGMYYEDTGIPWVAPSPNMPSPATAMVYPGQVLWEGTNVSEGRGTTQPFELFGAPFIDREGILSELGENRLPGCVLRPHVFEPTSNKWGGIPCRGFQIHVTDRIHFQPYRATLMLLQAIIRRHRESFQWKLPPYEYEYTRMPIDLLIGDRDIRRRMENMEPLEDIEESWQEGLEEFKALSRQVHLYP